ncbi:MAG: bifunctional DNA-binding transcriptional regulator [Candidatus Nanohaloarchaea archaeon]|jgi:bifunctional DNA-binding transcriptional regulator/antitoxin component of YhaV-PrlF toxin-antitoxin module
MVKLQKDGNGRYHITVPKSFIEGFGWDKGDEICFEIKGEGTLEIEKD